MKNVLRKVVYSLASPEYFPDEDLMQKEIDETSRQREGYFHRWFDYVDTSGEIPCIKPLALIEDASTGKMEAIQFYFIQFNDKPE